jgi:NADH-quinone oxidoreductase subunit N
MIGVEFFSSLLPVLPAFGLLVAGCVFLLVGALSDASEATDGDETGSGWAWASLAVILLVWGSWWFSGSTAFNHSSSLFRSDAVSRNGAHLALFAGALIVAISIHMTPKKHAFEFHSGLLILLSGLIFASAAADLTSVYLSLELVSIPTVMLLSISRRDDKGREATLKYFALGAFASALFLMGASYLYGLAGTTSLSGIATALTETPSTMGQVALSLVLAGLAFRVTAVPFHFYAPDVFSGCSLSMAAILSTLPKIAGFVAMIRLLGGAELNPGLATLALPPLLVLALISMTLGNCAALIQTGARRLLAYSSVAHTGYLMLGLAAVLIQGTAPTSVLAYLGAYIVMTLGVFAGITAIQPRHDGEIEMQDFTGITRQNFWLGGSMTVCLLSYIGIPLTAGFWAKFGIFQDLIAPNNHVFIIAAIIMAVNAVIAAIYYLSIIIRINTLVEDDSQPAKSPTTASPALVTCIACAGLTLVWFFFPKWM